MKEKLYYYWLLLKWLYANRNYVNNRAKWRRLIRYLQSENAASPFLLKQTVPRDDLPKYSQIIRLHDMLQEANVPHEIYPDFDGFHILYPDPTPWERQGGYSIVEFKYAYGGKYDLLEILDMRSSSKSMNPSPVGWLTAEEVFEIIKEDWNDRRKQNVT